LDSGQEQCHEHADDCDNDEQLHQRKTATAEHGNLMKKDVKHRRIPRREWNRPLRSLF
jgi:hypothetical protein